MLSRRAAVAASCGVTEHPSVTHITCGVTEYPSVKKQKAVSSNARLVGRGRGYNEKKAMWVTESGFYKRHTDPFYARRVKSCTSI
jgi:hypothetical protein